MRRAGEVSIKKGRSQAVDRGRRDEMTREGDKTKFRTQEVTRGKEQLINRREELQPKARADEKLKGANGIYVLTQHCSYIQNA